MHDKLADMTMQKKQLADGSTVYMDINVPPTAAWHCQEIGERQSYNWQMLQVKSMFGKGPHYALMANALDYANQNNLKPNYINLNIPDETTFSTGDSKSTTSYNLHPGANAIASFYIS
jgi:hypothetical protein